ncbi:hypothetical protein EXM63_03750 [Clostridium botulinum]|uniref:Uncharacterized protein n=1 Tax=Clostridium botulinum TaxID=1491 RepID=A0A6M0SXX4_CLOBO|nr:hypothetical protein [Clostridium botulinum]NFI74433.1 hypothetical protein [Clostridium sporogenes]NFP62341.1 hypothetical protein [Clostridium sporogenes]NFU95507.1 hypothetical protein [Clostridium sporogenes]NFV68173.1 hypothetical protein [Clostridium botulinum]
MIICLKRNEQKYINGIGITKLLKKHCNIQLDNREVVSLIKEGPVNSYLIIDNYIKDLPNGDKLEEDDVLISATGFIFISKKLGLSVKDANLILVPYYQKKWENKKTHDSYKKELWREITNEKISRMAQKYKINYSSLRQKVYKQLAEEENIDLYKLKESKGCNNYLDVIATNEILKNRYIKLVESL